MKKFSFYIEELDTIVSLAAYNLITARARVTKIYGKIGFVNPCSKI